MRGFLRFLSGWLVGLGQWRGWVAAWLLMMGSAWASAPAVHTPPAPVQAGQPTQTWALAPDADSNPHYSGQTNAQRAQVQPGNNAPLWRAVGQGNTGYSSLPYPEAGNLVQPFVQYPGSSWTNAGEAWRQVRNHWLIPYGGSLLLIMGVAIGLFYRRKGPLSLRGAPSGRLIERFTYVERAAHWVNAVAFVALAVSGLVMAFGKFFLLPLIGSTLFGWLAYLLKNLHNFVGPLFAVSLTVVIVTFARDNWPRAYDLKWLLKGGGFVGEHHIPSHRFNAGEKILFWLGVFLLGILVSASGIFLDKIIPQLAYTRGNMQIAHMLHAGAALFMMLMFMGHIYLGTIGMHGAYKAMKTGYVDETWAKEHHSLWYDDIKAGRIPAQRSSTPQPTTAPSAANAPVKA